MKDKTTAHQRRDKIKDRISAEAVIREALQDPESFAIIGEELALPVETLLDYESLLRRVCRVVDVPPTHSSDDVKTSSFPSVDVNSAFVVEELDRAQEAAHRDLLGAEDRLALRLLREAPEVERLSCTLADLSTRLSKWAVQQGAEDGLCLYTSRRRAVDFAAQQEFSACTSADLSLVGYLGTLALCTGEGRTCEVQVLTPSFSSPLAFEMDEMFVLPRVELGGSLPIADAHFTMVCEPFSMATATDEGQHVQRRGWAMCNHIQLDRRTQTPVLIIDLKD